MPTFKPGDRVRIVTRSVTEDDRKKNQYFEHMAGLYGTIQQVFDNAEVAVQVEEGSLSNISRDVQKTATQRMRDKFFSLVGEEQRKQFTKEELEFSANYVLLVQVRDLEMA